MELNLTETEVAELESQSLAEVEIELLYHIYVTSDSQKPATFEA